MRASTSSLRQLFTVFTPSSQGLSPVSEESTSKYTVSRLSRDESIRSSTSYNNYSSSSDSDTRSARRSMGDRFSHMTSSFSSNSLNSLRSRFAIRRSPSQIELEQEEERQVCRSELIGLVEPRPSAPCAVGSFEDVLYGRI